ncbi:unnamed protein product [Moneuplotes crassus]|uniref:Uncharacterized protein n=1 Tax=Euplotes crassus TaxID=5936 RepID=A0AAD1Y2V3_EUPCR|nr:unnamed protein product [Moneuplotes crassus]
MNPSQKAQEIVDEFNKEYLPLQRQFKIKMLKCQINHLEDKALNEDDAEKRAFECFNPMKSLREQAQAYITTYSSGLVECLKKAHEENEQPQPCIDQFREGLYSNKSQIEQIYRDHMNML